MTLPTEWLERLGPAVPTYATPPRDDAPHALHAIETVAAAIGTPLMPWQRLVARVASERNPDAPSQYRYRTVVLTVPRQSGKTTLMRCVLMHRALVQAGRRSFYTAQTGKDARERWRDLVDAVQASPLRSKITVRKGAGDSQLILPNASSIRPFAPTAESLHGYTPHDVFIDEAFAFDDAEGQALMGAIGPAQITLPDRQLWIVSTAGSAESAFLRRWVENGREAVDDPTTSVAFFEWSMPENVDPYDAQSWAWHPALGHTITEDDLRELAGKHSLGDWLRYYGNRWTAARDVIFDDDMLEAIAAGEQTPPPSGQLTLAYEAAVDRSIGTVWACWTDPVTGQPALRTVARHPGVEWMPATILQLRDELRPQAIAADDAGVTRAVTEAIRREDEWIELTTLAPRDAALAWDTLRDRIRAGTISVADSPGWREACANAVQRTLGQGWAVDRMKSRGQVADLIAAMVALRVHEQHQQTAVAPLVEFA